MEQSLLGLWAQRIIGRLMKLCNTQSVLFAAGADQDAPALRKALPAAEFFLLRDGEGDTPVLKEFDRAIGRKELSPQSGFALSYIGEGLFSLPEEEARQTYERLRGAAEFAVLRIPASAALSRENAFAGFNGLCAYYADGGAAVCAGFNPARRSAADVAAANMPRYAVYGIYKNEEKFIERFLNSVQAADEIVLCDTGTTDRTNEIIADFKRRHPETNLKTYPISVQPWRFDDAYNAALSLVGGDIDWCINMGMDETLMENWRSALDAAWDIRYTRCYHKFQTDWGNGAVSRHYHDRPHARRGYVWRLPVHEILEYNGEERVCWNHNFCIYHAPDTQKPRSAYLPLMEISVRERPDVWKTWGFLASEYMAAGRMDDATAAVERAMALPGSDKGYLYKLKFFICRAQGRADLALLNIDSAISCMPGRREPYVEKANYLHALGRSAEAYLVLKQAARQTAEITDYHHNASCWGEPFSALMAQIREAAQKEAETL